MPSFIFNYLHDILRETVQKVAANVNPIFHFAYRVHAHLLL
jgi:hypothetical protein